MTSVRTLPLWFKHSRIFIAVFALSLFLAFNPIMARADNLLPVEGSASIDASSLVSTSDATPTITGTALSIAQVKVSLINSQGVVYASNLIPVINGQWSVEVGNTLALGQYTVVVYAYNDSMLATGSYVTVAPAGSVLGATTSLSPSQIEAVLGLLHSFNVDSETTGAIEAQLNGTFGNGSESEDDTHHSPTPSSTPTGAPHHQGDTEHPWATSSTTRPAPRGEPNETHHSSTSNTLPPNPGRPGESGKTLPSAAACGQLMRSLRPGDQGSDVSNLQEFLGRAGDLHASSTGFFGPMTEHALAQFQARMNLASSSDNGAGSLGPRTRELIMRACKDTQGFNHGISNASSLNGLSSAPQPICVLSADKTTISSGESVIISWTSQYATAASSVTGIKGPPQGSLTLSPSQTTSYIKKVYGPGGEGQCTLTITVTNTTPASEQKVVVSPKVNVASVVSAVGQGLFIVADAYLSLFKWQQ